jgi:hypothetical protein
MVRVLAALVEGPVVGNRTAVDVGQAARGFQRWGSRSSMARAG